MKTRKMIQEMKENFIRITPEQEQAILNYWGEKIGNEFTEQDICEQTRKAIQNAEKLRF